MSIWNLIERIVLAEAKMYRGDTGVTFKDVSTMVDKIAKAAANPNGGAFDCQYHFNPNIWGKWFPNIKLAIAMAASDKGGQHVGDPQGGMMMKKNYGGRISFVPGKPNGDFERLPSSMDRYDILMVGEVTSKPNSIHGKPPIETGMLSRVAYSPSIGSYEERSNRIMALLNGQGSVPTLRRRPQPDRPEPSSMDLRKWNTTHPDAQPVRRVGQNLKPAKVNNED